VVRRRAAFVEQPRLGQHEGARAHAGHPAAGGLVRGDPEGAGA
jgi:hypothetical protein